MADPVDDIIDNLNQPVDTTQQTAEPSAEKVELDRVKAELERLQSDPVIAQLRENPNLLHDLRAQQIQNTAQPQETNTADQFWTDPAKASRQEAEKMFQERVAPMAQQIGSNLVGLYIQSFKSNKLADPFYNVVAPMFDKEIAPLRASLAGYNDSQMQNLFSTVWNAKVGEYVQKRQAERPKEQPVNLGGGGSGATGGAKQKRHLREIDESAYRIAVAGGLTEEQMAELAEEFEA